MWEYTNEKINHNSSNYAHTVPIMDRAWVKHTSKLGDGNSSAILGTGHNCVLDKRERYRYMV